MSGFFVVGEKKERPGVYKRYENAGGVEAAGARSGVGCALVTGNWGALNKPVTIDQSTDVSNVIGAGSGYDAITAFMAGGMEECVVVRVGTGGTPATITLKDTTTSAAVDAFLMVHNGIWDKGLSQREALWRDFLTSVICAGIFSVLYGICLGRMGATEKQTIYLSLLFLGGITIVAFIVLRVLSYFNRKRRRISVNGEQRDIPTSKLGCTKIYNAKDIVEAGRIVELLKEHGIAAFSQEAGASVSMHGASGFGMYGMDVLVETDEVKRALQIMEAADDSQGSEKF